MAISGEELYAIPVLGHKAKAAGNEASLPANIFVTITFVFKSCAVLIICP